MLVADDIRACLLAREPVFDQPEFIWDENSFDAEIAPDFREVGASGRRYEREYIKRVVLKRIEGTEPSSLTGGYRIEDVDARPLVDGLVHLSYTLHAQGRVTRRSTFYRRTPVGWQAVFHQGTILQGAIPLPPTVPEPRYK